MTNRTNNAEMRGSAWYKGQIRHVSTRALLPYSPLLKSLSAQTKLPLKIRQQTTQVDNLQMWIEENHLVIASGNLRLEHVGLTPRTLAEHLVKQILEEQPEEQNWQQLMHTLAVEDEPAWMLPWKRYGHYLSTPTPSGHRLWILSVTDAAREGLIQTQPNSEGSVMLIEDSIGMSSHGVIGTALRGQTVQMLTAQYTRDLAAMRTALNWAQESFDVKVKVGACILNNVGRVCGVGYNGRAAGESGGNLRESSAQGMSGYVHAEANALMHATMSPQDNTIYITHEPCAACARLIISSRRIKRVVYMTPYRETAREQLGLDSGTELLNKSRIQTTRINAVHVRLSELEHNNARRTPAEDVGIFTTRHTRDSGM